jgi:predicted DNA-binding transcriptional regulator YafY
VVTAVRAGDQAAATRPAAATEALNPSGALAALREAIDARASVVIGYVDNHGSRTDRVIDPLGLDGGQLRALDHRAAEERYFAVHRISSVRMV